MKLHNVFESQSLLEAYAKTDEEVQAWFTDVLGEVPPYTIEDGHVQLGGSFKAVAPHLKTMNIRFGRCAGDFEIAHSGLTNLKGFPATVGGSLRVTGKHLTSLAGGPSVVMGDVEVIGTSVTNLKGAPSEIDGNLTVKFNERLTSLTGAPARVEGNVTVMRNPKINGFDGFPSYIGGRLILSTREGEATPITTSLKGISKHVKYCKMITLGGVTENILGLTMIDGLTGIEIQYVSGVKGYDYKKLEAAVNIVRKYLGKGKDKKELFACQKELQEANLDDFAGL